MCLPSHPPLAGDNEIPAFCGTQEARDAKRRFEAQVRNIFPERPKPGPSGPCKPLALRGTVVPWIRAGIRTALSPAGQVLKCPL